MDLTHAFAPSFTDMTVCNRCGFAKEKHGTEAVCDSCDNVGVLSVCNKMALCRECIAKEIATSLPSVPVSEITPSQAIGNTILQMSRNIDNSISVSTDLFNANTTPIIELKSAIDADETIPANQKHYKLAEVLLERFNKHKRAIFDMQTAIVAEHSSQRAIQQYLNNLASSLQTEEREKLKLADINYKPEVVKEAKPKVSKPKTATAKITNAEVKAACAQFGVDEFMVRMTMTAKSCTLLEAVSAIVAAKAAAMQVK